jgi:hypothetical protein
MFNSTLYIVLRESVQLTFKVLDLTYEVSTFKVLSLWNHFKVLESTVEGK